MKSFDLQSHFLNLGIVQLLFVHLHRFGRVRDAIGKEVWSICSADVVIDKIILIDIRINGWLLLILQLKLNLSNFIRRRFFFGIFFVFFLIDLIYQKATLRDLIVLFFNNSCFFVFKLQIVVKVIFYLVGIAKIFNLFVELSDNIEWLSVILNFNNLWRFIRIFAVVQLTLLRWLNELVYLLQQHRLAVELSDPLFLYFGFAMIVFFELMVGVALPTDLG